MLLPQVPEIQKLITDLSRFVNHYSCRKRLSSLENVRNMDKLMSLFVWLIKKEFATNVPCLGNIKGMLLNKNRKYLKMRKWELNSF